jgi:DNA-binding transcriptional regulator YdaS (Cro superfamily)
MSAEITKIIKKAILHVGSGTILAQILGVNRSSVSRWLHGVHMPSADYMIAMQTMIKEKKK